MNTTLSSHSRASRCANRFSSLFVAPPPRSQRLTSWHRQLGVPGVTVKRRNGKKIQIRPLGNECGYLRGELELGYLFIKKDDVSFYFDSMVLGSPTALTI